MLPSVTMEDPVEWLARWPAVQSTCTILPVYHRMVHKSGKGLEIGTHTHTQRERERERHRQRESLIK